MNRSIPRILILILVLALVGGMATAETEKDGYHFDDKGFLTGEDKTMIQAFNQGRSRSIVPFPVTEQSFII